MAELNPFPPLYTGIADDLIWVIGSTIAMAIAIAVLSTWLVRLNGAQGEAKAGRVLYQHRRDSMVWWDHPKSEERNLARVAVLVDNSSENRSQRERACSAK